MTVGSSRLALSGERLERDLATLGAIGRDPAGGMTRLALSESDAAARAYVARELGALGCELYHDQVGNLFGRRGGTERDAAPVVTGSHLDTVPRGGRYDGPLGVVGAVEALRAIAEAGVETRRPIEIAVFVGEEGSRFGRGTIGSAAVAGDVAVDEILSLRDASGVSFEAALATYGDAGDARPARRERGSVHAFVELHIEQGGVLESRAIPIGVPTAIAGLAQQVIRFFGDANHAGATPMDLRRDALVGAAELVSATERIAREVGDGAVATVGKCEVEPGAFNIIPGAVALGTDLRAADAKRLDELARGVAVEAERIAAARRLAVSITTRQRVEPGPLDERVAQAVERAARALDLASHRMLSGAIHDALHMANLCASGMIFVPSKGGKSHCPEEESSIDDMIRGCRVLAHTLVDLANDRDD